MKALAGEVRFPGLAARLFNDCIQLVHLPEGGQVAEYGVVLQVGLYLFIAPAEYGNRRMLGDAVKGVLLLPYSAKEQKTSTSVPADSFSVRKATSSNSEL